jgi:hypothetical protein
MAVYRRFIPRSIRGLIREQERCRLRAELPSPGLVSLCRSGNPMAINDERAYAESRMPSRLLRIAYYGSNTKEST